MEHNLVGLVFDIRESGLHNLCGRFEVSSDHTKIFLTYRDYLFHEQFAFIERKRNTGYRISTDTKPFICRTKKAAFDYLEKFLLAAVAASERYTVVTVAEYASLVGTIRYNKYLELNVRLDDLNRYNAYLETQTKNLLKK